MVLGLYDIDLWHSKKSYPNLELMKVFNYYYSKNCQVKFMRPTDDEGRFSKIIYFKDSLKLQIPKSVNVYGEKKDIYGYGFYKSIIPLSPEIAATPPIYLPYDAWTNKLSSKSDYESMKHSSYIRLETNDFSDYKKDASRIYLADHDFFSLEQSKSFLEEYSKNHKFCFVHMISAKSKEEAEQILKYSHLLNRKLIIDFNYDEDFFYRFFDKNIFLKDARRENETDANCMLRFIKTILWYKKSGTHIYLPIPANEGKLWNYLYKWAKDYRNTNSYYEYYKDNVEARFLLDKIESEIRLLLKQNPQKVTPSILDLKRNL